MRVSLASHVGRVRDLNEDHLCVWDVPGRPDHTLLVVADGMGGHQAGEVASRLAVDSLRRYLAKALAPDAAQADLARRLAGAIRAANRKVYRHGRGRMDLAGMGTTLTAALVAGDSLFLAHVGDSRAYMIRGGRIRQLTDDHSLVGELLRTGSLSEAEAMAHPQRHMLTRALGVERQTAVDVVRERLEPGDRLVLATDGLTALVSADEILAAVTNPAEDFDQVAARLVGLANLRGGMDNVTVIVAVI